MKRIRCLWVIGCLWFPLMGWAAAAPPAPAAQLSPEQRHWLAQQGELRVGVVLQAPYAQYDRRLQRLSGVNVELMKWLAKNLNVELSWRNFPDLEQLEAAAREGEIDIAPGLTQTPGGLRLWQFSDPYMRVPQLVVTIRSCDSSASRRRGTKVQPRASRCRSILTSFSKRWRASRPW